MLIDLQVRWETSSEFTMVGVTMIHSHDVINLTFSHSFTHFHNFANSLDSKVIILVLAI